MPTDRVIREKGSTPVGSATFIGLRALDPLLQYGILSHGIGAGLITKLGSSVIAPGPAATTGIALLDGLNLSPYRLAILGMATSAAVKHSFWLLATSFEVMPVSIALPITAFNAACSTMNSLLFICAATSPAVRGGEGPLSLGWPPVPLIVGGTLFVTGILVETISEVQRKIFKSKPENEGKPHTSGLFSVARHINYTGYTMWRVGFALASAGWIWSSVFFGLFAVDFTQRGVPVLDDYCQQRYGTSWSAYKKNVPYKLIPYIY